MNRGCHCYCRLSSAVADYDLVSRTCDKHSGATWGMIYISPNKTNTVFFFKCSQQVSNK